MQERQEGNEETFARQIRLNCKKQATKYRNNFSPIVVPDIPGTYDCIRDSSRGVPGDFIEEPIDFLSLPA